MKELKYSYIKSLISEKSDKYCKNENKNLLLDKILKRRFTARNGSFVSKGDILFSITIDGTTIDILSPFSGYIEYNEDIRRPWFVEKLNDDSAFVYFFEYEYEIYFRFGITVDKISNSKRVVWDYDSEMCIDGHWYGKSRQRGKLELNFRANLPCLHFRYENFHLKINDRVYFVDVDSNPIVDLVVVKKEHKYGNRQREVDFILSNEDVKLLRQCRLSKLVVKFANDDKPVILYEYDCYKYESINGLREPYSANPTEYNEYLENCKRAPYYRLFQLYLEAYCSALDRAGISYQDERKSECCKVEYDYCYVYIMHDKRNGYHKIGISKEPKYREKTLQSEQPAIEMICNKRYPSRKIAEAIESALHKAYAEHRVRGEWFALSPEDVIMLKESLT